MEGNAPVDQRFRIEATATVAIALLTSIPALRDLFGLNPRSISQLKDGTYKDRDGESTREDVDRFSNLVPKTALLVFSIFGLASSLYISVVDIVTDSSTILRTDNWFYTSVWVVYLFNSVHVFARRDPVRAYELGTWLSLSAGVLLLASMDLEYARAVYSLGTTPLLIIARALGFVSVIGFLFASMSLPRRPEVHKNGRVVNGHYTAPLISRITFNWSRPMSKLARAKKDLEIDDFPALSFANRSGDLSAVWAAFPKQSRLWKSIIRRYSGKLTIQMSLASIKGASGFIPHWFTLKLLEMVERGKEGGKWPVAIWFIVLGLTISIFADGAIESWLYWLSNSEISLPIRSQLSALIFEKSMRRKNVKTATGPEKDEEDKKDGKKKSGSGDENEEPTETTPLIGGSKSGDDAKKEKEDKVSSPLKTRQGIINLIGLDTVRVSFFFTMQFYLINSVTKGIVAITLLMYLLGWIPVAAGVMSGLLLVPINNRFSKMYGRAQERMMKARDEQLQVVNEALLGARQIKFSALEDGWEKKLMTVREKVLKTIWDAFLADTALVGCWIIAPLVSSATALSTYAILNDGLTPSVAFVGVAVFRSLESALSMIPELISEFFDSWISMSRIEKYLQGPELRQTVEEGTDIGFENASIAWPADEEVDEADRFVLRDLDLTFPSGELSVISGKTGSGKSLILSAIIGEVDLLAGKIRAPLAPLISERFDNKATPDSWIIPSAKAYVAQIPWIENASLRHNVLFGLPFDEQRYNATIDACALRKDLEILTDGDMTELGSNGVNLSGGQKWRVTLARAIYSRAGILILDDIFSAVDAHVGRHIYEQCLTGDLCRGRTRILVTHHIALCQPRTKFVVELGDGAVRYSGFVEDLQHDGTLDLIKQHEEAQVKSDEQEVERQLEDLDGDGGPLAKVVSKAKPTPKQFVEDEKKEKGSVKLNVYHTYLTSSGGYLLWGLGISMFLLSSVLSVGRSYWLKIWTSPRDEEAYHYNEYSAWIDAQSSNETVSATAGKDYSLRFYLGVYIGISATQGIISTLRFFYTYCLSLKASRVLFKKLTFAVLRTPLRWIDTVPVGRVLNRFTADFNTIDTSLARNAMSVANAGLNVIAICVATNIGTWYLFAPAILLSLVCVQLAKRYLAAARPTKRLESNNKSPMFELYGSALSGVSSIRAFGNGTSYIEKMYGRVDNYIVTTYYISSHNRWLNFWMMVVGTFFTGIAATLVLLTDGMTAALAGFTISFSLDFINSMNWLIRTYGNIELDMNAAERVMEYIALETEDLGGEHPPAAWPTEGKVEVQDLVVGYADDLPAVLKGISFTVNKQERVGVVGRTGAGKSSLTLALFRFLEPRSGKVVIDGLDITKLNLKDLRSRLAIIPQDPVLFSGTVRSNLDPFDDYTDAELRDCLERVHLISSSTPGTATPSSSANTAAGPANANIFENLTSPISEGGGNLSQGQRQLLCLARAIVARPRVMVLDEATSAVDMHTDGLIQRSIREQFSDSTLIVIAHRLSTIADFDKILVLSDGEVAEFGTPAELWEKQDGIFRSMCEQSGEKERLRDIIQGKE